MYKSGAIFRPTLYLHQIWLWLG